MKIDIYETKNKYGVIYADPPWRYDDNACQGACERHYATMRLKDNEDLPVADICEKDCVLFLWTTYPMLREALEVMKAWGASTEPSRFNWSS